MGGETGRRVACRAHDLVPPMGDISWQVYQHAPPKHPHPALSEQCSARAALRHAPACLQAIRQAPGGVKGAPQAVALEVDAHQALG